VFLLLIELTAIFLASIFIGTQVIVPAMKGALLFPIFRPQNRQLDHQLHDLTEQLERKTKECQISELQKELTTCDQ
jgi:hypothetical protein